jgi:predicted AlkP superfamily phosphohydrolase/phosphomutase
MSRKKLVLIGIDGGTFDAILPLVQRGELPNLQSLMDQGKDKMTSGLDS